MVSIEKEFENCELGDTRLNKRLNLLAQQMFAKIRESIPTACNGWADSKAAYRFFDNPNFSEAQILEGHFKETAKRFKKHNDTVLVMHDTSEFIYQTKATAVGKVKTIYDHRKRDRDYKITLRGILLHSLRGHINSTRIPIHKKESVKWIDNIHQTNQLFLNPERCVHIGDREADIFELYSECSDAGTFFVVRLAVNRCLKDSDKKLFRSI